MAGTGFECCVMFLSLIILIDYVLPINSYNGVTKLLETFKSKKINLNEWKDIYAIAMKKLSDNEEEIGMDNEDMKCIGVDIENNEEMIYKMVTKFYVKPTRNKEGVLVLSYESSKMVKQSLNWIVMCVVGVTSVAIIWKRWTK